MVVASLRRLKSLGAPRRRRSAGRMAAILWFVLGISSGRCAASRPPLSTPARVPAVEATSPATHTKPPTADEPDVPAGIFHRLEPGQTLWRIARAYGIPLEELLAVNAITDPTTVAVGRTILVPGATARLQVPPFPAPPPPDAWPREPNPRPVPAPRPEVATDAESYVWPVSGGEVMSPFGVRRRGRLHAGLDIRGPRGQEILATLEGEVVYSGSGLRGYGKVVVIEHGGGVQSVYAHASELLSAVGDRVARGQPVARVGRTGNATTEHCHFEIRKDDSPVDPLPYFPGLAVAFATSPGTAGSELPSPTRASAARARRARSGGASASH